MRVPHTTRPARCPRCRNRLIAEGDWAGDYLSCLGCGYVHETPILAPAEARAEVAATEHAERE
jgi:uncharacterized Zn finger protein